MSATPSVSPGAEARLAAQTSTSAGLQPCSWAQVNPAPHPVTHLLSSLVLSPAGSACRHGHGAIQLILWGWSEPLLKEQGAHTLLDVQGTHIRGEGSAECHTCSGGGRTGSSLNSPGGLTCKPRAQTTPKATPSGPARGWA